MDDSQSRHTARGVGCAKETIQGTAERTSLIRSIWSRHTEFYNLQVVQRCTGSRPSHLQTNGPIPIKNPVEIFDNRLIYCRILNRCFHASVDRVRSESAAPVLLYTQRKMEVFKTIFRHRWN